MFNQYTSRRGLLKRAGAMGTVALAAGTVASCSSASGGGTGGHGTTDLSVTWWGNADRAKLYRKALDLYGTNNPDVKTTSSYADLDPYLKRLATQAAAGSLPDVLWMRDDHIGRYGASGSLLDLKKYIGDTIKVADLGKTAVSDGHVGQGDYALPTHYVGQGIIINTDIFSKAGITYPEDPNWEDIAAIATEVSKTGGKGVYGCNDPTLGSTHRFFQAYVRQSGLELFTDDGGLGFGRDTLGDFWGYWQKLRKQGTIPPPDTELQADSTSDQNLLVTKKAGFLWESSNHLPNWQALMPQSQLKMYSLPLLKGGSKDWWYFPPILISVSAKTKAPEQAAALVNFFLNNKEAAKITKVDQGAPSSSAIRKMLIPMLSEAQAAFVKQIDREMDNPARPLPILPQGAGAVNSALGRMSQQVAYGKQSISEAADAFLSEAKKTLGK